MLSNILCFCKHKQLGGHEPLSEERLFVAIAAVGTACWSGVSHSFKYYKFAFDSSDRYQDFCVHMGSPTRFLVQRSSACLRCCTPVWMYLRLDCVWARLRLPLPHLSSDRIEQQQATSIFAHTRELW